MSESGPKSKTIGLVAAKPWYSFFSVKFNNLVTIETNYRGKQIK